MTLNTLLLSYSQIWGNVDQLSGLDSSKHFAASAMLFSKLTPPIKNQYTMVMLLFHV